MSPIELFAAMIVGHAIADYPLQGDFLARAKSRAAPLPGVPWQQAMAAHGAIHAGFVGLLTGSVWLGVAEFVAHVVTDDLKCSGKIDFNTDQAIHVTCKAMWLLFYIAANP